MKNLIKYVDVVSPGGCFVKQRAVEISKFYLHSLLPDDPFARIHGLERFTELYIQAYDENVYKIFFDKKIGRLVMISGENSVYHFTAEEAETGQLDELQNFYYGDNEIDLVIKIEGVATLRAYPSNDEIFKDAPPALLIKEFVRQQKIAKKLVVEQVV